MEVGVADAAEEDFELYVVLCRITPRDRVGGQRRCRTGSGVSLRVIHGFMLLFVYFWGLVLFVADLFHPVHGLAIEF